MTEENQSSSEQQILEMFLNRLEVSPGRVYESNKRRIRILELENELLWYEIESLRRRLGE